MLSPAQVVKVREAIEKTYIGSCSISERQKSKKTNGATKFEDVLKAENEPCRLSFETLNSTSPTETASGIVIRVKLFISPDIEVKPGSKLTVAQNGRTEVYKSSGKPAVYKTHQEIMLIPEEEWA